MGSLAASVRRAEFPPSVNLRSGHVVTRASVNTGVTVKCQLWLNCTFNIYEQCTAARAVVLTGRFSFLDIYDQMINDEQT